MSDKEKQRAANQRNQGNEHVIRLLNASEIECRASRVTEKGVSLLLYKDARVDQRILDETFGIFGWKRSHQMIDGNLYCTVEVRDPESGQWVGKQDVGTFGSYEKEKSQSSDSFKRACYNWGIGRELYTAPFIWIPAGQVAIQKKDGKCVCNETFRVISIGYNDNREINRLAIANQRGVRVYAMGVAQEEATGQPQTPQKETPERKLSAAKWQMLAQELERTGVSTDDVRERYHLQSMDSMSDAVFKKVMKALAQTPTEGAA
ncbi:MAG: hypothetical protein J1E62_09285 [Lachnospiraceae bacterium]|nr:hypothetical protein [Lachnospiraceae bacterium]